MDTKHKERDVHSLSVINKNNKRGKSLTKTAGFLLAALPLFSMQPALADDIVWNGSALDSDWQNTSNWAGGVVPGVSDVATFDDPANNIVETMGDVNSIQGLKFTADAVGFSVTNDVADTMVLTDSGMVNENTSNTQTFTNNGTLTLNSGSIDAGIGITNDGTFNIDNVDTLTINEAITGGGILEKNGAGTAVLLGESDFTGGTNVNAGVLQLGNASVVGNVDGGALFIDDGANVSFYANDDDNDLIFSHVISGDGSLTHAGTAKLILSDNNTYTGLTEISGGGDLELQGTSNSSEINVSMSLSNLIFNASSDTTFAGVISGSGSLVQDGGNVLTLTGVNTYSGSTTIQNSSTLEIAGTEGSLISQSIVIGADSSDVDSLLVFNRSSGTDPVIYTGTISGHGGLTQTGDDALILSGNNTYSGLTTVEDGSELQIGNGGASGALESSEVSLGAASALTFNRSGQSTFAGVISNTTSGDATITQSGSADSVVVLNGASDAYDGNTLVQSGTLLIGGDSTAGETAALGGNITVSNGATLGGFGRLGTATTDIVTIQEGGLLSPGASIGTVTVAGDYDQDGSLLVELSADGRSDQLVVTGNADLDTTTSLLTLDTTLGFDPTANYNILQVGGTLTGQFSNVDDTTGVVTLATTPFLSATVDSTTTPGTLLLTPSFNALRFAAAAQTPNQNAVANYLLQTGGTTSIQSYLGSLTTDGSAAADAAINQAFRVYTDQISGATYANQALQLAQTGRWFNSQLSDRMGFYPQCEGVMDPKSTHTWPDNCPRHVAAWILPYGSSATLDADNVSGLDTSMGGVALGADMPLGNAGKVGVAFAGSSFSSDVDGGNESGSDDGNLYQFGVYGSYTMNDWILGASLDIGFTNDIDATRNINDLNGTTTLTGSYSATLIEEQIRATYDKQMNQMRVRPFVGLVAQQVSSDSFTETGNVDYALNVSDLEYNSVKSQLGVSLQAPAGSHMTFVGSLAWQHEFADDQGNFNAYINQLGSGTSKNIVGTEIGDDSALIKAGFVVMQKGRMNATIMYEGVFASSYSENGGRLQLDFDLS